MSFNLGISDNIDESNHIQFDHDIDSILSQHDLELDTSSLDIHLGDEFDVNELNELNNIDIDEVNKFVLRKDKSIALSDTTLLCFKTLISPIAVFFHVGRFAFSSAGTAISFAIAFSISDIMFFFMLDKFSLFYARYILLAIAGIVALFSIKGVVKSFVNLSLSLFKGIYSWYFSLFNPDCSFSDFLFGKNVITKK